MNKQNNSNSKFSITGEKGTWVRDLFFYLGIIGAIGLRVVLILNKYNQTYAKISWYVAMVALAAYYYYRRWVEIKRRDLIIKNNLLDKTIKNKLNAKDRENVAKIIGSTLVSKQMLNLNFLFIASILAIIIQIMIDR